MEKKQPETTPEPLPPPTLTDLIRSRTAIPVLEAIFHSAVNGADKTPEERFTDNSTRKTRNVTMFWTEHGLWCAQRGKLFLVPASNVKSVYFK